MTERVRVCPLVDLAAGEVRVVVVGVDRRSRLIEALVMRRSDGTVVAYLNRCRHLPIPLDGGSRRFLSRDPGHLECGTHGALYRIDDGACVAGPCTGEGLQSLPVVVDGGTVFVVVDDVS